ncbi:bifunctional ADP-dependent NAD(P)H-hydrate dehydratase/NAD(P)H-hydrate epimerase [Kocuria sp.]|uniref:bifunctional ADP-dependent NAD(P)H-hydrate dehydratase/NAD(P)H-hydrate epimerase n=1 Tax=Kocuria sp. TaxID=1871328 RepID=UPI0026DEEDFF|nr:bifunctional ADP-dependent NAD(P)H-hydrate dehydratase/NAD(P)H-hydrate epimerase [Kocuria sp.]MDO5617351.1 NAD(P)H-hydrate dehydratase [Kocuria sp.]
MIPAWTGEQIRAAEQPLLDQGSGPALMRRAAHALSVECVRLLRDSGGVPGSRVTVLAGTGNNGADALWAAVELRRRGAAVTVVATGDHLHAEAEAAVRAARIPVHRLADTGVDAALQSCLAAAVVLDGVLGTGARGGLRGDFKKLVERFSAAVQSPDATDSAPRLRDSTRGGSSAARPVVVAVDTVSGLDPNTGAHNGHVLMANTTVTFGGAKAGHAVPPGRSVSGHVVPVEIGIEDHLPVPPVITLQATDVQQLWPTPRADDHKYTRGVLGVVAGSPEYPGAAVLCTRSAVAAGAGMVRYLGDQNTQTMVTLTSPEVVASADDPDVVHVQAWVAGPGAVDDQQRGRIGTILDLDQPAVLDAGALDTVGRALADRDLAAHHILTPHAGELAELLRWCQAWGRMEAAPSRHRIESDPLTWARAAASATGATVVLKGAATVVAGAGGGPAFVVGHGSPWLATAGSGDCLAGILGTLAAHVEGRGEVFAEGVQQWLETAPLTPSVRAQLLEQFHGEGRWALVAAVGVGLHATASRIQGEGPQPCQPEHIRAALTREPRFPWA